MGPYRIKKLLNSKDTIIWVKSQPTEWENLLPATHSIEYLYLEYTKISKNEIEKEMKNELNRELSKEETQIAEKYFKSCSTTLAIRGI